jgi:hypothetical protein
VTPTAAEVGHRTRSVRDAAEVLVRAGVEVFASVEFGEGPEPLVRFYGGRTQGFRALAVADEHGFRVAAIRRVWTVKDGEPTGPVWELVFVPQE